MNILFCQYHTEELLIIPTDFFQIDRIHWSFVEMEFSELASYHFENFCVSNFTGLYFCNYVVFNISVKILLSVLL